MTPSREEALRFIDLARRDVVAFEVLAAAEGVHPALVEFVNGASRNWCSLRRVGGARIVDWLAGEQLLRIC